MASMRVTSPERRWRAAAAPLMTGLIGWLISGSLRLGLRPGLPPEMPLTSRIIVTCVAVAVGIGLATLILRTHLTVSDAGLADHRMFRVVRVPWPLISGFQVDRPGSLWGGYCVTVLCHNGSAIDLMATRAYSRVPSGQHLDELTRICWSLEDAASRRGG